MKATDVIRRDHQAAKDLFAKYKSASEEERDGMMHELFSALNAHEHMEDTYFYPEVMKVVTDEDKELFKELEDEQAELEAETLKVRAITIFGDRDKAMQELMDRVLTHAEKEEQTVLARADELLDPSLNESLGEQMEPESAVAKSAG